LPGFKAKYVQAENAAMRSNTSNRGLDVKRKGAPVRRSWESLVVVPLALACLLTSPPAHAQARLEKAAQVLEQQARTGKGEFISFLIGAASAYRWSEGAGTDATYCPPDTPLDGRRYANITLEEYRRGKAEYMKISGYPLDVLTLALLRSLRAEFPCPTELGATRTPAE
jgi:hypothetical protein